MGNIFCAEAVEEPKVVESVKPEKCCVPKKPAAKPVKK